MLRFFLGPKPVPNRSHRLIVGDSKHLYCADEDMLVRFQQKPLDHRTCGKRKMITKYLVVDEETGVLWGEAYARDAKPDLVGLLARAWVSKRGHPMHGAPAQLVLPQSIASNEALHNQVSFVCKVVGTRLVNAPSGWGPAAQASRAYESELRTAVDIHGEFPIAAASVAAHLFSVNASAGSLAYCKEAWAQFPNLEAHQIKQLDQAYVTPGAWRADPFNEFVDGFPEASQH